MIYNLPSLFFRTLQVFPHDYKPVGLPSMSKHLQLYSPLELMINYGQKFMLGNILRFRRHDPLTPTRQPKLVLPRLTMTTCWTVDIFKSNEKDPIKTILKWTEANQVFLAILDEKYPHEIANLMLYAQTVQKIAGVTWETSCSPVRRNVSSLDAEMPSYMSLATKKCRALSGSTGLGIAS